ncbi:hypothetical protein Ae201684P_002287 [Aphanomyces euteiches]|uniref:Protein kinase domain-containing protein n=1 Tax=Aphanomyces euteiches TaxID=100861 RepID=A0A6G0X2A0_9STRA|nr:hypothetical protein Ae201684_009461 [Aphanomyces euteiches]KAH9069912.1 hypothetical protein Ae201684P_002287 [Aphanomyces euteiches]KAH9150006.1 hypothetical protein AeRB84_007077 [Aphanomyces euteiches]
MSTASSTPCAVGKTTLTAGTNCPLTCQNTGSGVCVLYANASACVNANAKSGTCTTQSEILRHIGSSECQLTFTCPTMSQRTSDSNTKDPSWSFYVGGTLNGATSPAYVGANIEVLEDLTIPFSPSLAGGQVEIFQLTGNAFTQPKGTMQKITYPSTFFSTYTKLNRLFMFNLDLKDVLASSNSSFPANLQRIHMVNANLDSFPGEIAAMKTLTELNFTDNNLKTLPSLQSPVTTLSLAGNLLTDLTNVPSTVTKLDLSRNKLTSIPSVVFSLPLTELYLSGNGLQNVVLNSSQFSFLNQLAKLSADFTVSPKCPAGSGFEPSSTTLTTISGSVKVCVTNVTDTLSATPSPTVTAAEKSGLGTGAIVGIIVGAVVVIVVGLFFACRRRRSSGGDYSSGSLKHGDYYTDGTGGFTTDPSGGQSGSLGILNDPELLAVRINAAEVKEIQMISRGGFGEVWSGIYQNRPVAIKRLLPDKKTFDDAMAFAAEIKVMARLNHPKIVEFIGASWSNALSIQAISEYMNCGDLKSLLERSMKSGTDLPWLNVKLNLAVDITDALVYLHTLNPKYIHRDLKSRNILIDADNGAKLSDFGISRNRAADETMTAGVGTCRWMAPEVIRGEKYDESCDVWSFGCVLSEMDSGNVPYNDATNTNGGRLQDHGIMEQVSQGLLKPSFTGNIPKEILDVAMGCLEFNPSRRPTSMQVSFALRKFRKDVEKSSSTNGASRSGTSNNS